MEKGLTLSRSKSKYKINFWPMKHKIYFGICNHNETADELLRKFTVLNLWCFIGYGMEIMFSFFVHVNKLCSPMLI